MNKKIKRLLEINNVNCQRSNSTNSTFSLNLFNVKSKKHYKPKTGINETEVNKNFVGKPKYYPPAHVEWFNSIYAYNRNTIKLLPTALKDTFKLVKSYFNFYSQKLEKKVRFTRIRNRVRRLSTNRILISKPELKHTSDKVIVIIYAYNRQKKYYLNKMKRVASIDNIDSILPDDVKEVLIELNGPWPSNLKLQTLTKKILMIRSKVKKHQDIALKTLVKKVCYNKFDNHKTKDSKHYANYEKKYLKDYVSKCLRREILSTYFKQLVSFNKSKFEQRYLLPLTTLVSRVYNKEVEFQLVDLKYLYNNSNIFSETLVTKLRNRKNMLLRVLKTSLLMFKLPPTDRTAVYAEIYNRKRKLQNIKMDDIISDSLDIQVNDSSKVELQNEDILELSLSKIGSSEFLTKLKDYRSCLTSNDTCLNYPLFMANTIIKLIKHKYVSGIRIQAAGRLTRRNTAARSVFKLRYKGNIKNMDSSYKGLPSVLLRGYAKSNLQFSKSKSRIRIGSFGLKGWVSS